MRHRLMVMAVLGLVVGLFTWAGAIDGRYTLVKDSDGKTPGVGAGIELTLQGGSVLLKAVRPGETFVDKGSYHTTGNRITISFTQLEKSATNQVFSYVGGQLVLPLKFLSDGPGASIWRAVGSSGHGDSGNGVGVGSSQANNGQDGHGSGNGSDHGFSNGSSGEGLSKQGSPYAPLVGMWTGDGSSYEVRFRRSKLMSVAVLSDTVFTFFVEPDGTIKGMGTIVYDVDPNLCGVAALARQVNQAIDMMQYVETFWKMGETAGKIYKEFAKYAAAEAGEEIGKMGTKTFLKNLSKAEWKVKYDDISKWWKNPLEKIGKKISAKMVAGKSAKPNKGCRDQGKSVGGLKPGMMPGIMNAPGVTKVQYEYKGLENGPETRLFYIKGHVGGMEGGYRIYLEKGDDPNGDDPRLWLEHTVNYKTERKPFPCWSPFLKGPGRVVVSGDTASVSFQEHGKHRNGVNPWQEYIYTWNAHLVSLRASH